MEYEEYLENYLLWCAFFLVMTIILIISTTLSIYGSSLFVEMTNLLKVQVPSVVSNLEDFIYRNRDVVELCRQPKKVAVLTGGNRGIGLEVLKKLLECEITVILGVRDPKRAKESVERSINQSLIKNKVFYEKCDTGDMKSVKEFARKVQQKAKAIHLLINNAGILCPPYQLTKDGFESQMAINYIGHFLLTHLLMPQLIAGGENNDGKNARIVNVSSCSHKCGNINYDDFNYSKYFHTGLAYGDSKLAQIMSMRHVEKICNENGWKIQSHAAHPGIVDTELFSRTFWGSMAWARKLFFKTPERGSRTLIYAAISPKIEGKGGSYLSNCSESSTNQIANNDEQCRILFDFTCDLLKIEKFGSSS